MTAEQHEHGNSDVISGSSPAQGALSSEQLLHAISGLCGPNRMAATALLAICKKLVGEGANWSHQTGLISRMGLPARHYLGQLGEALDLPGDLALLKISPSEFLLLQRREQRWQVIGIDGEAVTEVSGTLMKQTIEACVLRMPFSSFGGKGIGSLVALWPALRSSWAEVGGASLLINVGQLLLPVFAMLVYDKVVSNGVFETLWALTIGMIIYLATDIALRIVRNQSIEGIGCNLARQSDEALWAKLTSQIDSPPGGFARFLSHYRDLSLSRDFVSSNYLLALADTPFVALYLLAIAFVAWPLAIVSMLLIALYSVLGLAIQRRATTLGQEAEAQGTRKLAFMGEMLTSLDIVRTVPGAGAFVRRWRDLSDEAAHVDGQRRMATSHLTTLSTAIQTCSTVTMLVAGAYLIEARLLTVGGLIAANLLTGRALASVGSLLTVLGKWKDFQRAATRMESSMTHIEEHECTPRPAIRGDIRILSLAKHYEGRAPALDSVSLSVSPGERVALLGRPGAGKTTLLRCLAGLCQPSQGQILIDALSLGDISRTDRKRWLAWKPQEPALFAGTLEDNLRVAGAEIGSERFNLAIWASCLDVEFSNGCMNLGMQLDERGSNLSGGQRQKVALARAFAQPSRILLLDEPTLGLDPDSERLLAERLPQLLGKDDILIMTTHSSIMLKVTQRVIALNEGKIIADGPTEKLVRVQ